MKLFEISGLEEGRVLRRMNMFTLEVELKGKVEKANLRNSGRLPELVKPGNKVLPKKKVGGKTSYIVYLLFDGKVPVLVNSSLHNLLTEKILVKEGYRILKREVKINKSRIDFLVEKDGQRKFLEVKGCTLVKNNVALFPDSPTERGLKHLEILEKYCGEILFLVMRYDATIFSPNFEIHREFAEKLKNLSGKIKVAKLEPKIYRDSLKVRFLNCIPLNL